MVGKKPPKIDQSQIERALGSSRPVPPAAAQPSRNSDKRAAPRKRIWAPCRLTWPPNGSADGVCIDVSETGARIRFSHRIIAADRFRLSCPGLRLNHECEIIRQDGFDASIRFLS